MAIGCDLIVIATSAFDYYASTFILLIYVHIFLVFKTLMKLLDRKSNLFAIFEVLVTQVLAYIKGAIYISMMMVTFILLLSLEVQRGHELTNDKRYIDTNQTIGALVGYTLAWFFDNQWMPLISEFEQSYYYRPYALVLITTIVIFLVQAFFKNILIRLFLSIVIGSRSI